MLIKYIFFIIIQFLILSNVFACPNISGHYQFYGKVQKGDFPFKRLPSFDIDGLRRHIASKSISSFHLMVDDTGDASVFFYDDKGIHIASNSIKLACVEHVWTWHFTANGSSSEGAKIEIDLVYSYIQDENKNLLVQENGVVNTKYYSSILVFLAMRKSGTDKE